MNELPSPAYRRPIRRPKRSPFFIYFYPAFVGIWTVLAIYGADRSGGWGTLRWAMIFAPLGNIAFVAGSLIGVEVRKVFDRNYRAGPVWTIVVVAPLVSQVVIMTYAFMFGRGGG